MYPLKCTELPTLCRPTGVIQKVKMLGNLFSRITLQVGKGEIRETNPSFLAEETKDSIVGELNGVVPLLLLQPSLPHSCFTD